jgi:hypothetical protein
VFSVKLVFPSRASKAPRSSPSWMVIADLARCHTVRPSDVVQTVKDAHEPVEPASLTLTKLLLVHASMHACTHGGHNGVRNVDDGTC